MRTLALMNQKGGVGKTTTTANLGAALAELGQRVCLVDLDPQTHLTINCGSEPDPAQPNLYHILVEEMPFTDAVKQVAPNLSLVPSSIDLAAAEVELVTVLGREAILRKRLVGVDNFDFLLFDCPPSLGLLTINALAAASEVLIPMQPHFFAMQGVAKLLETVHLVSRRLNPQLKVTGIVLTLFDAQTRLTSDVVGELESYLEQSRPQSLPWSNARIFQTRIRRNIKLAESPSFGQTILTYGPGSNGAVDYRALAKEVLGEPVAVPSPAAIAVDNPTVA